jgi:hypothetical protein
MPAVTYFHSATSSFRASATMVVFLRRPPLWLTRSLNHRASADCGWCGSHSQASWIIVVRNRGLPALDTPCSCATDPLLPRRRRKPCIYPELLSSSPPSCSIASSSNALIPRLYTILPLGGVRRCATKRESAAVAFAISYRPRDSMENASIWPLLWNCRYTSSYVRSHSRRSHSSRSHRDNICSLNTICAATPIVARSVFLLKITST